MENKEKNLCFLTLAQPRAQLLQENIASKTIFLNHTTTQKNWWICYLMKRVQFLFSTQTFKFKLEEEVIRIIQQREVGPLLNGYPKQNGKRNMSWHLYVELASNKLAQKYCYFPIRRSIDCHRFNIKQCQR